jgi:hypothetical protein
MDDESFVEDGIVKYEDPSDADDVIRYPFRTIQPSVFFAITFTIAFAGFFFHRYTFRLQANGLDLYN